MAQKVTLKYQFTTLLCMYVHRCILPAIFIVLFCCFGLFLHKKWNKKLLSFDTGMAINRLNIPVEPALLQYFPPLYALFVFYFSVIKNYHVHNICFSQTL